MSADLDRLLSRLAATIAREVPAEHRKQAVDGLARRITSAVKHGDDPRQAVLTYVSASRAFAQTPARRQTLAALRRTVRKAAV